MNKVTITVNGTPVEIELTAEQIAQVTKKACHYTDIKTLQDALNYIGESEESFNHRTQFDDDVQRAGKELEVIFEAIRQGNELGNNKGDYWYYPWFNAARSSSGFSFTVYRCVYSTSGVGSRLCVENDEKAEYIGRQFIDIYNRYINGEKLKTTQEIKVIPPKEFKSYKDIKTFEDACLATGTDVSWFNIRHAGLSRDTIAHEQLKIIAKALNGNKHMDYKDTSEYKYYPWFNSVGSSSGFSFRGYDYVNSGSTVGSRLTYKSKDIATYAGKQFLHIYDAWIN